MYANNLVTLRQITTPFSPDDLITFDWEGVDLNEESMDWPHKRIVFNTTYGKRLRMTMNLSLMMMVVVRLLT